MTKCPWLPRHCKDQTAILHVHELIGKRSQACGAPDQTCFKEELQESSTKNVQRPPHKNIPAVIQVWQREEKPLKLLAAWFTAVLFQLILTMWSLILFIKNKFEEIDSSAYSLQYNTDDCSFFKKLEIEYK